MKNEIIKFLKNFDAFGETHTFRINKEKTYNSPVGGFFFLIFLLYSIYYIIYTFSEFLNGKYKSKEYDMKMEPSPTINMSDHKYFSIAFCIRNEKYETDAFMNKNLQESLFYTSTKLTSSKSLEKIEKEILMKDCGELATLMNKTTNSVSEHQKKYWEILQSFQLDGCKCINFEDLNESLIFSSNLEGVERNSFSLNIKYPSNKNNSNTTISINDYINNNDPHLHVYFPEYSADMYSVEEPLKIKMHQEVFSLSPMSTLISEINLGLLSFTDYYSYTDDDIYNHKNKLIYDSRNNYKLNSFKDDTLLQVQFNLSGNAITYKRTFQKLQEYLANTIGYLGNIVLLVYIISSVYNVFGSKRFLSEKFFYRNKELKNILKKEFGGYKDIKMKRKNSFMKNKSNGNGRGSMNNNEINSNNNFKGDPKKDNLIEMENKEKSLDQQEQPSMSMNIMQMRMNMESSFNQQDMKSISLEPLDQSKIDVSVIQSPGPSEKNLQSVVDSENTLNVNLSPAKTKLLKNNYTIFFYEYVYYSLCNMCKNRNNNKTKSQAKKLDLYKSTEYFYYYYMDISNYLKMMFEFEIVKSLVMSKNKKRMIRKLKPYLKRNYFFEFDEKLKRLYSENILSEDINKIKEGVKALREENNLEALKKITKFI
jgi:hypothetical protein